MSTQMCEDYVGLTQLDTNMPTDGVCTLTLPTTNAASTVGPYGGINNILQ